MWFSTHSLRRKMAVGGVILGGMLVATGLLGYRFLSLYSDAVASMEFGLLEVPRRAELDSAVGRLFQPLVALPLAVDPRIDAEHRSREFAGRLADTRRRVRDYFTQVESLKLHESDLIAGQRPVLARAAVQIEAHLSRLENLNASVPYAEKPHVPLTKMLGVAGSLIDVVQGVPDTRADLRALVRTAAAGTDKLAAYVFATLGSFACLSFLLIWFVYSKVFGPLRELHRCVTRVAHGDFDYDVPVRRRDEIGELAEAFNQMTARFRETRDGLDRQVRERSMQLVRSERLAGVGFLSAGVAHEINNPLSAIAMAAESFETRADRLFGCLTPTDRAWAGKKLAMIQRESFRCQTITRRLLDFARGSGTERHDVDLNTLVGEVLELVSHMTKFKDRSIVFEPGDPAFAAVNAGEIKQVMLNLVSNSLAATDPGGTLKIEVVGTTDTALLTFADDGCGMSEETIEHLFEPFFTRQRDGRGTGLGMSISNRIVTDHGGTIEVASDGEGLGSTFTVTLPRKAVGLPRAA